MAVSGKSTVYDGWFCFKHSNIADEIMAVITMGPFNAYINVVSLNFSTFSYKRKPMMRCGIYFVISLQLISFYKYEDYSSYRPHFSIGLPA